MVSTESSGKTMARRPRREVVTRTKSSRFHASEKYLRRGGRSRVGGRGAGCRVQGTGILVEVVSEGSVSRVQGAECRVQAGHTC